MIEQTFYYIQNKNKGGTDWGSGIWGHGNFYCEILHPKLTFVGTSEKGSILNIDEAETSCVCQRNLVGLIDLLG